jgi:hypothetical protein
MRIKQPPFSAALNMSEMELLGVKRVMIIAAGTSYYAGRVVAYLLESLARIPAVTELASEVRYRNPIVEEGTLYFALSQSGETPGYADGDPGTSAQGRPGPGHLQRCGIHHRPGNPMAGYTSIQARKSPWLPRKPLPAR